MKYLTIFFFALAATGCGATLSYDRAPPELPDMPSDLAQVPAPPKARLRSEAPSSVGSEILAARQLPDIRTTSLVTLPFVDAPRNVQNLVDAWLPALALRHNFAGLLDPRAARSLEVKREHTETKGAVRDQITWSGPIEKMALLGKVSSATLTLAVHHLQLQKIAKDAKMIVEFEQGAVEAYAKALAQFRTAQQNWRTTLKRAAGGWAESFAEAQRQYEADGGRYDDSSKGKAAEALVARHRAFVRRYETLAKSLTLGNTLPQAELAPLEQYALHEAGADRKSTVQVSSIEWEARVLDAEKGEIFWIDQIHADGRDDDEATLHALEKLLDDLAGKGK